MASLLFIACRFQSCRCVPSSVELLMAAEMQYVVLTGAECTSMRFCISSAEQVHEMRGGDRVPDAGCTARFKGCLSSVGATGGMILLRTMLRSGFNSPHDPMGDLRAEMCQRLSRIDGEVWCGVVCTRTSAPELLNTHYNTNTTPRPT